MATSIAYGPILVKVVEKLSAGFDIKKEVRDEFSFKLKMVVFPLTLCMLGNFQDFVVVC